MKLEIRNELLLIASLMKNAELNEDKKIDLERLLDNFQYQIEDEIKDAERIIEKQKDNLEILNLVRSELIK